MKLYKKDILNQLRLNKVWNTTTEIYGIPIATVMWDSKPWKVIEKGIGFKELTNTIEVRDTGYFKLMLRKRTYEPVAEFKTQAELSDYIFKRLGGEI